MVAAWLAPSTTVPEPVSVTVLPTMVAGPLVTEYVTAPFEAEAALTVNGASPKVCVGIAVNASVGVAWLTVKLVDAVADV